MHVFDWRQEHNRTLSVNLEQHAAVLERLIGLNTELMDQVTSVICCSSLYHLQTFCEIQCIRWQAVEKF